MLPAVRVRLLLFSLCLSIFSLVSFTALPFLQRHPPEQPSVKGVSSEDSLSSLTQSLKSKLSASTPDKALDQESQDLLSKRKQKMLEAFKNNPQEAFDNLLPLAERQKIPESLRDNMEQDVTIEGTFLSYHGDDFENQRVQYYYTLTDQNQKHYSLRFADRAPEITSGSQVRLKGVELDQSILTKSQPDDSSTKAKEEAYGVSVLTPATFTPPKYAQKLLVILTKFSDQSVPADVTKESIEKRIFPLYQGRSINDYYLENSNRFLWYEGQVVDWVTLPYTAGNDCKLWGWADSADQLARDQGTEPSNYRHKMYFFPGMVTACQGAGYGGYSPTVSWMWTFSLYHDGIIAHEMGHGLGPHHANAYIHCTGATISSTSCIEQEYGDPTDVMGWLAPLVHFNAPHKAGMGWILPTKIRNVTTNGTYYVYRLEERFPPRDQILKIAKPDTQEFYYVSYRRPVGYDASLLTEKTRSVSLHIWNDDIRRQTKLVNLGPGTGYEFYDPINKMRLTPLAHNPEFVTLSVEFGVAPFTPQLELSVSNYDAGMAFRGQERSFLLKVKNTLTTAVGGVRMRLNLIDGLSYSSHSCLKNNSILDCLRNGDFLELGTLQPNDVVEISLAVQIPITASYDDSPHCESVTAARQLLVTLSNNTGTLAKGHMGICVMAPLIIGDKFAQPPRFKPGESFALKILIQNSASYYPITEGVVFTVVASPNLSFANTPPTIECNWIAFHIPGPCRIEGFQKIDNQSFKISTAGMPSAWRTSGWTGSYAKITFPDVRILDTGSNEAQLQYNIVAPLNSCSAENCPRAGAITILLPSPAPTATPSPSPTPAPTAVVSPLSLSWGLSCPSSVSLRWNWSTRPPDLTGYRFYRCTGANCTPQYATRYPYPSMSSTNDRLNPGSVGRYFIRGDRRNGSFVDSNTMTVTNQCAVSASPTPTRAASKETQPQSNL